MKLVTAALSPTVLGLLVPVQTQACRVPPRPSALLNVEADAIVLALISNVGGDETNWRATALPRGALMGKAPTRAFEYDSGPMAGHVFTSCDQPAKPKRDRYWVLYMQRTSDGLRVNRGYPYWWAKASGDPRLVRLDRLLPLGAARKPTATEDRLLDLAEARITRPDASDLSRYTRIYARASPSWVVGRLFRSQKPQRLMVDDAGEFPTEDSCGCKLINIFLQLDDLWRVGQLPPFDP